MGREHCAVFPRGYLPMDCPVCGRHRLEYGVNDEGGVVYVRCEKCGSDSDSDAFDHPSRRSPSRGQAPSTGSGDPA